jgi:glycosyltransferase involved in cell wall biosynthesis
MSKEVSVLMSVYNGQRWLAESIQSVLNQTYVDFEFIIVDDGSDDSSLAIARQYARNDPRMRVLTKSNTGLGDSLNYGLDLACGKWIARIDADDICFPTRIAKQLKLVKSDHRIVLVGSGLSQMDENSVTTKTYTQPYAHNALVRNLSSLKRSFAHSSAFFSLETARKLGGYRAKIHQAEDLDLWLRLSETGRIRCIQESLVGIRKHSQQISNHGGGYQQLVDSHVATISYWSRKLYSQDPVEVLLGSDFRVFHDWVGKQLISAGILGLNHYISSLKTKFHDYHAGSAPLSSLISAIFSSPMQMQRYLRKVAWGSDLPRKLAHQWMTRNPC